MSLTAKSPLDLDPQRLHLVPSAARARRPGGRSAPSRTRARTLWLAGLVGGDVAVCAAAVVAIALATGRGASLAVLPLAWPLMLACTGRYAVRPVSSPSLLPHAVALAVLGWVAARLLTPAGELQIPPEAVAVAAAVAAVGSRAHRRLGRRWATRAGLLRTRTVVVGHAQPARRFAEQLGDAPDVEVVGTCVLEGRKHEGHAEDRAGLESLPEVLDQTRADTVVVLPCSHLEGPTLRRLGWQLERHSARLVLAPGLGDVDPRRTSVGTVAGLPVLHVAGTCLDGPTRVVKEVWERAAAGVALLVLSPLLLVLMVAVRLDSAGPAIFRQTRVGRHDRPFWMWKLRTMATDAEARRGALEAHNDVDDVLFKIRDDPRVTRVGRLLRRTSLDELPQLVNILRGQMSLVGPRPALPDEVEAYGVDVRRRLVVKPGLTGLWQVSGRSDLSWEESVRLDQRYVDNWSLRQDLAIVARTFRAVFARRGAY